jgi:hypothetical protein
MQLEKLLGQPADSPRIHLRAAVYGAGGNTQLLQEVLGLANADARGVRHIVFGVSRNAEGVLEYSGLTDIALAELQTYAATAGRFIEPDLRIEPMLESVGGKLIAALEISRCNNPPYILKTDASQEMRRGDCWVREGGLFRPAQRADLDRMYRFTAEHAPQPASNKIVQIGFGTEPGKHSLSLAMPDVTRPPSSIAASRMRSQIDAREAAAAVNVADTSVVRLMHTRMFGNDSPYQEHGINTLVEGFNAVLDNNSEADNHYFFETQAVKLNLSLVNTGHEALHDVSVLLILPWAEQFKTAERLYGPPGSPITAKESELLGYPQVKPYKSSVQVKQKIDYLEPDQVVTLFEKDLRIGVKPALAGRKVALRYSVHAASFDKPEEGRLKLVFGKP